MARKGGNPNLKGVKGKSGPRKKEDIVKEVMAVIGEKVTQEALIELANNKVFKLLQTCETIEEVKALGLPITLKGITEKIDHTSKGESIINNDRIDNLANILNGIYKKGDIPSNGINPDTVDSKV
jgi:hypothetical protein